MQKRIQREIDDANDESKVERQGGEVTEEKKNRLKRRKTKIFPFEEIESGVGSGANTPGQNRNGSKEKNLAEIAVSHWREEALHHSSDEFDSSSESEGAGNKAKIETRPRCVQIFPALTFPGSH